MANEKAPLSSKKESPLRRYFRFRPVVVEDEPQAQRIEFHVGNQTFQFGPDYCESVEHAEWFIAMGIKALRNAFKGMCNKCGGHGYTDEGDPETGPCPETCTECGGKGTLSTDEPVVETFGDPAKIKCSHPGCNKQMWTRHHYHAGPAPLIENCPKCGNRMVNWPGQMTKCTQCLHEWYMDSGQEKSIHKHPTPADGCSPVETGAPLCGDTVTLNGVPWRCTKPANHREHERQPENGKGD